MYQLMVVASDLKMQDVKRVNYLEEEELRIKINSYLAEGNFWVLAEIFLKVKQNYLKMMMTKRVIKKSCWNLKKTWWTTLLTMKMRDKYLSMMMVTLMIQTCIMSLQGRHRLHRLLFWMLSSNLTDISLHRIAMRTSSHHHLLSEMILH